MKKIMLKNKSIVYYSNTKYFSFQINVDFDVYILDTIFFNTTFYSFVKNQKGSCNPISIYIKNKNFQSLVKNMIFIDPNAINWRFQFLIDLENLLSRIISNNSIIFHASAIEHEGNGLMICGKRNCGKTTMTQKLLSHSSANYIDDDMVILTQKSIWGFAFPVKSRFTNNNSYTIRENENQNRYLINHSNISKTPAKLKNIIFPHYEKSEANDIIQIFGSQAYLMLIKNIKGGEENIAYLHEQLLNICKTCNFWIVKYCSDDYMLEKILPIL